MIRAVFDTNLLVSSFLTRNSPGGVTTELLRFAIRRKIELHLSPAIIEEVLETLTRNPRAQANYRYTPQMAEQYCSDLLDVATIIHDPPPTPGAVPRDPDDDKIVACAVAAGVPYIVSRDRDLLSLGSYGEIEILPPEVFIHLVRNQPQGP